MPETLEKVLIKWMKTISSTIKNDKFSKYDMKPDRPSKNAKKPNRPSNNAKKVKNLILIKILSLISMSIRRSQILRELVRKVLRKMLN